MRASPQGGLELRPLPERVGWLVAGHVDLITRPGWRQALDEVIVTTPGDVHLELADLTFIDAGGTGLMVHAARRLSDGGRLVLHRPPAMLMRTLDLLWPDMAGIEVGNG